MTAPHTPGTAVAQAVNVTFGGTQAKYHAVGIHDTNVAVAITGLVDADDGAINEANARRIVACLNAFDGLETEQVENMVNVPEFFFKHVELEGVYPVNIQDQEAAAAELRRLHAKVAELEAQLEAIGAGGVGPLMKPAQKPQVPLVDWVIKALTEYCNTGEIDGADDLLASVSFASDLAQQPLTDEVRSLIGSMVSELRAHRYCGDCYPENGWPGVNKVLADYAAFKRAHGITGKEGGAA